MREQEHFNLGFEHATSGQPRYKWQDPYLQKHYDAGYDRGKRLVSQHPLVSQDYVPGQLLRQFRSWNKQ